MQLWSLLRHFASIDWLPRCVGEGSTTVDFTTLSLHRRDDICPEISTLWPSSKHPLERLTPLFHFFFSRSDQAYKARSYGTDRGAAAATTNENQIYGNSADDIVPLVSRREGKRRREKNPASCRTRWRHGIGSDAAHAQSSLLDVNVTTTPPPTALTMHFLCNQVRFVGPVTRDCTRSGPSLAGR